MLSAWSTHACISSIPRFTIISILEQYQFKLIEKKSKSAIETYFFNYHKYFKWKNVEMEQMRQKLALSDGEPTRIALIEQ